MSNIYVYSIFLTVVNVNVLDLAASHFEFQC
jgi:hypothetical protein